MGDVIEDRELSQGRWLDGWLDAVAHASDAMSQRSLASIERHGGIDAAITAARTRGLHLVQLTDDKGKALVAVSKHPFKTLC